jgi:GGDEF domain-containing protein
MPFYFDAAADFATSLVVLTTLAWWYGAFGRWPFNGAAGGLFMGAAFGLVTVLQMQAPIEPVPGMIVDLRVVPIALAGAYLGVTGLLACLALAIGARVAIGGLGMEAGIASIVIAGLAGFAWSALTAHLSRRKWGHFLALGGLASLSLSGGFLLPSHLSGWIFLNVAPAIGVAYLLVIPLVAHLLERARTSMVIDREQTRSGDVDLPSGLSTKNAFARQLAALNSASPLPQVASVLALRIRHRGMLQTFWGSKGIDQIFSALRVRLGPLVHGNALLGRSRHGEVLIGLSEDETTDVIALQKRMARAVSDDAVTLPGGRSVRVGVDVRFIALSDPASHEAILSDLAPRPVASRPFRLEAGIGGPRPADPHAWTDPDCDRLFLRLDRRMIPDDRT